ncbi:VanZ like family protein [Chitinophaga costaii]|uniref:VanZ like family protein n=1 Tax=Chitinophaga costaii TaxID=1335309 RepID=A0A1C4DWZ8_9BACT|nr:VanZ family protein [Chitinophaga costaii]PUZ27843.1 VanZ family protein [Chitinophaga costaii]SCC35820.1 VanZ like family protein [Chitinophaga costaii]
MKSIRFYLPAIAWVLLILWLCTLPGKDIPSVGWWEKFHPDKVVHFGLFGMTVFLFALGNYWRKKRVSLLNLVLLVLGASAYGLAIEFIQKYWADHRSFDLFDALADSLGALAGAIVFNWFFNIRKGK